MLAAPAERNERIEVIPVALSELREPINGLYAGHEGSGKTTNMLAMAKLGKVLAINAESGIKAVALKKRGIPIENVIVYPDVDAGETISFDGLEGIWMQIREGLHKDPESWVGTVWDSATEIHKALLDDVVVKAVARADRAGRERDRHFIALEDYGVMTEQVRNLMRKFRDLPCHFAVSALLRRDQDDDGSVAYNAAITPKLGIDLVGWMDFVCVTSVAQVDKEDQFRGLFRNHSKYRGKDRLGVLPKWLVDPTFDRVVAYVEGDYDMDDLDSDPVMVAAREAQAREKQRELEAERAKDNPVPAEPGSKTKTNTKKERVAA